MTYKNKPATSDLPYKAVIVILESNIVIFSTMLIKPAIDYDPFVVIYIVVFNLLIVEIY